MDVRFLGVWFSIGYFIKYMSRKLVLDGESDHAIFEFYWFRSGRILVGCKLIFIKITCDWAAVYNGLYIGSVGPI